MFKARLICFFLLLCCMLLIVSQRAGAACDSACRQRLYFIVFDGVNDYTCAQFEISDCMHCTFNPSGGTYCDPSVGDAGGSCQPSALEVRIAGQFDPDHDICANKCLYGIGDWSEAEIYLSLEFTDEVTLYLCR